jgi:hypothetical protein
MADFWCDDLYSGSLTSQCFSSTSYDAGWNGAPEYGIDGAALQGDTEMRRLLELEMRASPLPNWARVVARQVERLAPCGWSFPQATSAICRNIGAADPCAEEPQGCYAVGQRRLDLMAAYAACLDGWLKRVPSKTVGREVAGFAQDQRDWCRIAAAVAEALGDPTPTSRLLTRALLTRLRFWLRAPFGALKADDNWRLGYLCTYDMGRYGGWDYFTFHHHDPDWQELAERIRETVPDAERWLDQIESTWPCAPKVFRYIERLILAIGALAGGASGTVRELCGADNDRPVLEWEGTCLDETASRLLLDSVVGALVEYLGADYGVETPCGHAQSEFGETLTEHLPARCPARVWLAALLLKRILLFSTGGGEDRPLAKCRYTRDAHQVR